MEKTNKDKYSHQNSVENLQTLGFEDNIPNTRPRNNSGGRKKKLEDRIN